MMSTSQNSQLGTHGTISEPLGERLLGTKAAVYFLWREHNGRKHGDNTSSVDVLFRTIDRQVKNRTMTLKQDRRMVSAYQSWIEAVGT
ncbi:hypothetical protein Bca52824_011025 [Brassica carinata]|uniref:Uncharacterized protein n=1 Tax=Brassica carinata TaxID=52824 RepID=A0A8X8BB98_BRACI|nr:hypothetical protein Bca52824_011025 [Brassica carinata]